MLFYVVVRKFGRVLINIGRMPYLRSPLTDNSGLLLFLLPSSSSSDTRKGENDVGCNSSFYYGCIWGTGGTGA